MSDAGTQDTQLERAYLVTEIFGPTIQGEGSMIGVKTMFIRFGGCDYRCKMCDSMHSVDPNAIKRYARKMKADEIVEEVAKVNTGGARWVTLSGGNPCIWDITDVVVLLKARGYMIAVETQGTIFQEWLGLCDEVTVSPKSPGMGEKFDPEVFKGFMDNLSTTDVIDGQRVSIKVVVFTPADLEFALLVEDTLTQLIQVDEPEFEKKDFDEGTFYLSIGNFYRPQLNAALDMKDPPGMSRDEIVMTLLQNYQVFAEEICGDTRFTNWKLLPQLHVLTWGNEQGR